MSVHSTELNQKQIQVRFPPLEECSKQLEEVIKKSRCNAHHMIVFRSEERMRQEDAKIRKNLQDDFRSRKMIKKVGEKAVKPSPFLKIDGLFEQTGTLKIKL
ncbi:hypothetical protein Ciccas_003443 [Cichlidogyrus casuarinus]|uniref:Uncharacterized protein n=1 Tax=Cichlidogyrus casuarinus TaxID=1844966 RepID=A0ABD2QEE3_9PLAT